MSYNEFHCLTAIPCDMDATTKAPSKGAERIHERGKITGGVT